MPEKIMISIVDKEFEHLSTDVGMMGYSGSELMKFDREDLTHDIICFTDRTFHRVDEFQNKYKVLLILEPEIIHADIYNWAKINYGKFHTVLTHHQPIIDLLPNAKWYPAGGSWFYRNEWGITPKSKNVSIIASSKDWTAGHRLRHTVIKEAGPLIDLVCGGGYKPIERKSEALDDYRFNIVIHNCDIPGYFTDMMIDPLIKGTVPIIYGSKWIGKYFDPNGFIFFDSVYDLIQVLINVKNNGIMIYNDMLPAIKHNYEIACKYGIIEDHLYNIFKDMI